MKRVVLDKSEVVDLQQVKSDKVYGAKNKDNEKFYIANHDFVRWHLNSGYDVFEFYSTEEFDEWFDRA